MSNASATVAPAQVDVGPIARSRTALDRAAALLELALECLSEGDPISQVKRCIRVAHEILAGRPAGTSLH